MTFVSGGPAGNEPAGRTDGLAGLREPDALDKLSPDERQECRTLWRDLDALLERAKAPK